MFHPKVLNRVFGEVCAFCNMGRFIEEKHEDFSFSEAEKYAGGKDEENCPLKQMRELIMDEILEKIAEKEKIEKEKKRNLQNYYT